VVNAEAAARAVLAEDATAVPKRADGPVEAMRILKTAKDSAVKARVQAINQLKAVLVSADPALREALNPLCTGQLTARCAELTTRAEDSCHDDVTAATVHTLGHLARRIQYLQAEIHDLQQRIAAAVESAAPRLLEVGGIAPGRGGHAPDRGR
jgi:hypothetical protein